MNNIFERLRQDHGDQRDLLRQLDKESDKEKKIELFGLVKSELAEHAKYEERLFYRPLLSSDKTQKHAHHGMSEHKEIDDCIKDIEMKIEQNSDFRYHMQKLSDLVNHHLEEEEHTLFQLAGKVLDSSEKSNLAMKFDGQRKPIDFSSSLASEQ